jgi:hypothetical protein
VNGDPATFTADNDAIVFAAIAVDVDDDREKPRTEKRRATDAIMILVRQDE